MTPIHQHRDTERALFAIGLRNVHTPNRQWVPGRRVSGAPAPPLCALRRQGNLAVDPGRPTTRVALGDLADAEQRVRPGAQHHLLQRPDRGPVLLRVALKILRRSLATFSSWTRHSDIVPVEHASGPFTAWCPTCPRFARLRPRSFKGSPAHVSALSGPVDQTGIRPVPRDHRLEERRLAAGPVAFRPPASASWASCPAEGSAPSRSAYRTLRGRTPTGFPRSTHARYDRGGRSLYPEASGVHTTSESLRSPLAASTSGQALSPGCSSRLSGLAITRRHQGVHLRSPVRPSPRPVAPRTERGPLGFFLELRTPTGRTCGRTSRRGPISNTDQELRPRHRRPPIREFTRIRDFVSHRPVTDMRTVTPTRAGAT